MHDTTVLKSAMEGKRKSPSKTGKEEGWQVPRDGCSQHEANEMVAPFDDGGRPKDETLEQDLCEGQPMQRTSGAPTPNNVR